MNDELVLNRKIVNNDFPESSQDLIDENFVANMTASQRPLRAYLLGLLAQASDVDDVLQEVNMALWRKRAQYDPKQSFLRWAFGFAALEARSFWNLQGSRRVSFSDSAINLLAADWPDAEPFTEDMQRFLSDCLKKLGKQDREVVESRYSRHLTPRQIADASRRPLSSVYKSLTRSLKLLRECIQKNRLQSQA